MASTLHHYSDTTERPDLIQVIAVPRDDYYEIPGGDRVMLEQIQAHSSRHDVQIDIVLPTQLGEWKKHADAVYITQVYQITNVQMVVKWTQEHKVPLFVSPLEEDLLPLWFDNARQKIAYWRLLTAVVGREKAEQVYVGWRYHRRQQSQPWREIRNILQHAHLVPNSKYELEHLIRWFALTNPRATVIPLGIDPEGFISVLPPNLPYAADGGLSDYILEVGLISRRKNQLALLQACLDREETIVLVGKPSPYESDYYIEVKALANRRKRVVFLESLTKDQLIALYAHARAHVLPSWSERPGLVTLEAVAAGCKVVSTTISPITEYLGNEVFLCDPRSKASIATAVEQAITSLSPGNLRAMVLKKFTWAKTGELFAKTIQENIPSLPICAS